MATGTGETELDFGAAPGLDRITVAVARATVTVNTQVEAYLFPKATSDKSVDDHIVDSITVYAHSISDGVGFSITGRADAGLLTGKYNVRWIASE